MRIATCLGAVLLLAGCQTLAISPPTLMSGEDLAAGRRGNVSVFHLDQKVVQLVDITWPDPTTDAGVHTCQWRWYRDGVLVSDSHERRFDFNRTPYTLRAGPRAAAPLGIGNYTVETLVDGKVVASSAFAIVA